MSESHKIVRVFVASPSGLDDERKALREVADDINRRHSTHWRLQFKIVGWEDTVGGYRRAQDIINRDLETCDYFFGIMADHWGSSPHSSQGITTTYTSGFEEEYSLAQRLFQEKEMIDIQLFFKDIPTERLRDAGPSLKKVLDFRNRVQEHRKPLYTGFDSLETFKSKTADALTKIGWDTIDPISANRVIAPGHQDNEDVESPNVSPRSGTDRYFLPQQPRSFLNELATKGIVRDAASNVDVARLRLISASVRRPGNDEVHIGVHDANLLFRARFDLDLSTSEKDALLTVGLRHMDHQNVPLWYWTGGNVIKAATFIQDSMISLDENISSAALKIADIFGYPTPNLSPRLNRGVWIRKWFENKYAYGLHNAAESYLAKWADEHDIPVLQELRDERSGEQAAKIDCIIICIKLRRSRAEGFEELYVRNPEYISPNLYGLLRNEVKNLTSGELERIAKLKAELLRLESIKELSYRGALTETLADELSGDDSVEVRLIAIKALADKAVPISQDKAEKALVVERKRRGLGALVSGLPYGKDKSRYEDYQRYLLEKKSLGELLEIDEGDTPFDAKALLVAFRNHPRKMGKELRKLLEEGFAGRFESRVAQIEAIAPPKILEITQQTREFKTPICLGHTREALDILAAQKRRSDLTLIRKVIDLWEIEASREVLTYLARFGDWDDVDRILGLKPKAQGGVSLATTEYAENEKGIGKVLCKLGNVRIVDLIDKIESHTILSVVIGACTRGAFERLSDNRLLQLMTLDDETVRRITVMRCLHALPKSRIVRLSKRYVEGREFRYYNVIHWLDLGTSMPKDYVQKIVRREIQYA